MSSALRVGRCAGGNAGAGAPVLAHAPAERQPALDRQLRLLANAVTRELDDDDRDAALVPDEQGIGSGADLTISWQALNTARTSEATSRIRARKLG